MLSPATLDVAIGKFPFGPAVINRQVTETELAQLLFLHLLQPLPRRQLPEHLALHRGVPLSAHIPGYARELPVLWIRIHFFRIRIQSLTLETNTDPDPIRIQGFNDQKLKKNYS
jgi:hypothetical protein